MYSNNTYAVFPPLDDAASPAYAKHQRLAGTGTTEDNTQRPLAKDRIHTIYVGANPIRVSFRAKGGQVGQVSTTDFLLPAYATYSFIATYHKMEDDSEYGSIYVYAEAADGVSAYEAFVVQTGR